MTVSDAFVAAPWVVFGVALAVVCVLLLRSRRGNEQRPRRPGPSAADPDGPAGPQGHVQAAVARADGRQQRSAAATGWKQNAPEQTGTRRH